jgi:DeoR/GlpR family transcriptional regulator of sugar metabolism
MTPEQCQIKKAFIRNADKTALLIEEDKLNVDSIRMFATFREIDYVITAKPIENRELVKAMTAAGVTLLHG